MRMRGGGRPPRRGPHDDRRALAGVVARERVVGRRGRLRRGLGVRGAAEQRRQSGVDVAARVEQGGLAPAPVEAHLREALDGYLGDLVDALEFGKTAKPSVKAARASQ